MKPESTQIIGLKQVAARLGRGMLALAFVAALEGCGGPTETTTTPATLPAAPEARDSVKAALTTSAADAASTGTPTADTAAAQRLAPKLLGQPK